MDKKISSFVSEHTVEFVLIPKLTALLSNTFSNVVPLYFWLSREGSRLAQSIHGRDEFRAVALFPRRPKRKEGANNQIFMTVNESVITAAIALKSHGIPSIGGCPLISSFWMLSPQAPCVFVGLSEMTASRYTFDARCGDVTPDDMILRSDSDLMRFVVDHTRKLDLEELVLAVRESRPSFDVQHRYGSHMFSTGYKPVLFLLQSSGTTSK